MKFLADEHIEFSIIKGLRELGIDITSIDELKKKGLDDEDILPLANKDERVIITRDSDFLKLNKEGADHFGIIFVQQWLSIGEIINDIQRISMVFEPQEIKNTVIFLPFK